MPDPRNRFAAHRQVHPWGEWWLVATETEWWSDTWTAKCHTRADAERIAAALNHRCVTETSFPDVEVVPSLEDNDA